MFLTVVAKTKASLPENWKHHVSEQHDTWIRDVLMDAKVITNLGNEFSALNVWYAVWNLVPKVESYN